MREKRGEAGLEIVLYALFEVAIIALFIAAVMVKVNSAVKDETYYQRFLARDLSLTVDAMHAAEGDFTLYYGYSTPKKAELDIALLKEKVSISRADERNLSQPYLASFLFGMSKGVYVEPYVLNYTHVTRFTKEGDIVEVYSSKFALKKEGKTIMLTTDNPKDIELK